MDGLRVHIRLMLNDVKNVHKVKPLINMSAFIQPHSTLKIVVDCPSEQERRDEEFSKTKTLAVARYESHWRWCFDNQEIKRREAIAGLRSGWSTAAASPTFNEGKAIGEYQELSGCEGISTNEGLGEHKDGSVSPSTMQLEKLS